MNDAVGLYAPQFLAGLCVEGAEHVVYCSADEDQSASRSQRTATQIGSTGFDSGWHSRHGPKWYLPGNITGIHINRGQPAPRRLPARPTVHSQRAAERRIKRSTTPRRAAQIHSGNSAARGGEIRTSLNECSSRTWLLAPAFTTSGRSAAVVGRLPRHPDRAPYR
jgi:hypothetical protein